MAETIGIGTPAPERPVPWGRRLAALAAMTAGAAGATAAALLAGPPPAADRAAQRAAPARPAPAATAPERRSVRIVAAGDVTLGSASALPPGGAAALLAAVRPLLDVPGAVVLGNLETALSDGGTPKCVRPSTRCYAFRAPPAYAQGLAAAGFTVLNLANNHAWDYGAEGQRQTVSALEQAGIRHTGRPDEAALLRVEGVRVAVLGFAPYPWARDLRDLAGVREAVAAAGSRADVVVVTMHAGAEGTDAAHVRPGGESYLGEQRGDVVAFARTAIDAGADLVVGHGPHVVRGLEWYRGRLVAYSLGNLSGHSTLSTTGSLAAGAVLDVTLDADGGWREGRLLPVRLTGYGRPVPDAERTAVALARRLSHADFGARAARIDGRGRLHTPRPQRPRPAGSLPRAAAARSG